MYPHPSWISTFLFFLLFLHGTCFGQWSIPEHDRSRGLKCPSVVWLTLLFSVLKRQAPGSPKSKENEETCIAHLNLTGAWNRAIPANPQALDRKNQRLRVTESWGLFVKQLYCGTIWQIHCSLLLPLFPSRCPDSCIFWGWQVSFSFTFASFITSS